MVFLKDRNLGGGSLWGVFSFSEGESLAPGSNVVKSHTLLNIILASLISALLRPNKREMLTLMRPTVKHWLDSKPGNNWFAPPLEVLGRQWVPQHFSLASVNSAPVPGSLRRKQLSPWASTSPAVAIMQPSLPTVPLAAAAWTPSGSLHCFWSVFNAKSCNYMRDGKSFHLQLWNYFSTRSLRKNSE